MIYMIGDNGRLKILILETANLDRIRAGQTLHTEDKTVVVAWCPDIDRLGVALQATGGDVVAVGALIDEARSWPEAPLRQPHSARRHSFADPEPLRVYEVHHQVYSADDCSFRDDVMAFQAPDEVYAVNQLLDHYRTLSERVACVNQVVRRRAGEPQPGSPDAAHPAPGPDVGLAPPAGGLEAGEHPAG